MDKQEQLHIFDLWLNEYKGIFFKVVRAYAFTQQDQDDLFQEIAIQVWRSIPNFRGNAAVSTWIYRVALNSAIAWTRLEKRVSENKRRYQNVKPILQTSVKDIDPKLEWLYGQIKKLDEIDRSLTLLLLDGYSYKEIADTLGINESNVGVKIHRIKTYLTNKSREENNHET